MNSFLCLSVLFAVASAGPKPVSVQSGSWAYPLSSGETWKVGSGSYYDGVTYSSAVPTTRYVQPLVDYHQGTHHTIHHSAPVVARSDAEEWKYQPVTWSDASYAAIPTTYSSGYYSAGLPGKIESQVIAKKVVAPTVKVDQIQPVAADPSPKLFSYSTEISHDVPNKKEEVTVSRVSPVTVQSAPARTVSVAQQVSAPVQYSAWSGEAKPATYTTWSEPKPASYASWTETKPTTYTAWTEPKPASYAAWTESKPATYTAWAQPKPTTYTAWSEPKPATYTTWSDPKPASYASWTETKPTTYTAWTESKPVSYGSWAQEVKPASWSSYITPSAQPSFYGSSWEQPVSSNQYWTDNQIQKRSARNF